MFKDVLIPFTISLLVIFSISQLFPLIASTGRLELFFGLASITLFTILITGAITLQSIIRSKLSVKTVV
jgi:hypothetical protein